MNWTLGLAQDHENSSKFIYSQSPKNFHKRKYIIYIIYICTIYVENMGADPIFVSKITQTSFDFEL